MKSRVLLFSVASLLLSAPVFAEGEGTPFFFEFKGDGGPIPVKDADGDGSGLSVFTIVMDEPLPTKILGFEIELLGLTHSEPADLEINLWDRFGGHVDLMKDQGDSLPIEKIDLFFNDLGNPLPGDAQLTEGTYQPQNGSLIDLASGGSDVWILTITDDSAGDTGSLQQWFIRGYGVPEPMTLSLLAVGALAFVRRRKVA